LRSLAARLTILVRDRFVPVQHRKQHHDDGGNPTPYVASVIMP
jgi:hypothetical protein